MAYEVTIQYAEKIADLTLNGLVLKGDTLAHNGTNWVKASATDAVTNLYAQYIAMQGGKSGDVIKGCKGCVLYDANAPYGSANASLYASGTAGAITATRPATNGDVIQVIGRSISTSLARIDILSPYELEVIVPVGVFNEMNGGALEGLVQDGTTVAWHGPDVDTAQVAAILSSKFPSGMVGGPLAADLIVNTQASTALNVDFTGVAAYVNETNVGDAGATITAASTSETTADNEIQKVSFLSLMDADFAKAGAVFAIMCDPDAGDFLIVEWYIRYLVV